MIALLVLVAIDWIEVPASKAQVVDPLSGIPVTVTVDAFSMTKTEITEEEFGRVGGRRLPWEKTARFPVTGVSWEDAVRFANALSLRDNLSACYDYQGRRAWGCTGYRLPTEAEWYAAAGGKPPEKAWLDVGEPRPAATSPADEKGFHDLYGNVWEWCEDWFAPEQSPWPVHNPRGPLRGLERVIRGGGAVSKVNGWSRGFRRSAHPEQRSEWIGFRLARTLRPPPPPPSVGGGSFLANAEWEKALGIPAKPSAPSYSSYGGTPIESPWFDAQLHHRPGYNGWSQKILVLDGDPGNPYPRPVLIVPYYDVDTPAGMYLGGRNYQPLGVRSYAWLAAQQGWIAVAVRWWADGGEGGYDEAVARLPRETSGLGQWVSDARALIDWVERLPKVDSSRIAMMGHSLGGKLTLYAAAFDGRIAAAVASEPGISLKFSNWGDPWYWGSRLSLLPEGADHDDLLRAIAPRPFLLIAGEDSDGEKSRSILLRAAPNFDFINHRKGHTPTPESIGDALRWLAKQLD